MLVVTFCCCCKSYWMMCNWQLNICLLFWTGADEWEIDKTLNKRAAKMTPSLKSCLFRDCQVGLLSEGTFWWGLYYLVRPVQSRESGTICWSRYHLVRLVQSGEAGNIWWGRYYLVRPVLSDEAGTICWGRYYLVRPILSGEAGTIWWGL